jgi:TIR domain/Domain of unknown function (DUF4384)
MSAQAGAAEVFISYASDDRTQVLRLADQLEQAGVSVWLDRQQISGASIWAEEIVKAIKACKVLLLVCSDAAMRSWAVKQEIQLAGEAQKTLLPLMLASTSFPEQIEFFLAGRQWIDAGNRPMAEWFPSLLHALEHAGSRASGVSAVEAPPLKWSLEEVRRLARFTDQLWPVHASGTPMRKGMRGLGAPQDNLTHGFRLGSRMRLMLEADRSAHLLLLDEGPEGAIYCLCPSHFAPDTKLLRGRSVFPQASSLCDSFVLTGKPGREELLAIITEEPLPLNWMPPDVRTPARVLTAKDVSQLLTLLQSLPARSWVALSTYFDVIV